jgi:hypothetical protein
MQRYYDTVTDQRGNALAGARVAVQSGGTNVAIYSDDGVTLKTNPMTTDASGGFSFYAANGTYDLVVTNNGVSTSLPARISLFDGAALSASGGSALVGSDDGASGSLWTTAAGFISHVKTVASALFSRTSLLAGRASNMLIRDKSAGATRVHIEPNGNVTGTAAKLDLMFDAFEVNISDYRILNFYTKTYSASDASTTQGNNGVAVLGVKGVGNHWGVWPAWHFGYSDDASGGAVPMKLYYFDTSDTVWRTPMKGAWRAGVSVSSGDYMLSASKLYQSGTTGTTGATAPTHAVGTVSDGTVDWAFVRDFAASVAAIKACVVFGDRDDLPKFGHPTARVQLAAETLVWNGKKVQFLDNTGAVSWNLYSPTNSDDLYIETADGARRIRIDATGQFIQTTGLALCSDGAAAADGDTSPSVKGVQTLLLNHTAPTAIDRFDDGVGNQQIFVRSGNGNATLTHGTYIKLKAGSDKTLTNAEVVMFHLSTNGSVAYEV